jgi:lysophospholipase L1-like esterase
MNLFIKYVFITWITLLSVGIANGSILDTIIHVDQEHQSISAPDAFIHQWYLNGEKIEGATKKNLKISETGVYKVEITNTLGKTTEIENSFLVTAAGAIIKIYIIGDSTVCNYAASAYPWTGWGQVMPNFFNTANLSFSNNAIGGRSSRSFYLQGRWTPIKNALNPGDYVFIQWGHNDRDYTDTTRYTSVADYKIYLTMYCNDTKAKGAIPVLISPMVLNAWTGNTMRNVFTENGNNYRGAMLEVATALNVAFVDLNIKSWNLYKTYGANFNQRFIYKGFVAGEYPNYPAGITDGTHFQEMGAICNARMIVEGIGELSARPDMANLISNIKPQYTIAVAVNPAGKDSMTTKSYSYPTGLTVTLKTIPKKSSTFQKWNNANNTQLSTATLTTVTSGSSATSYTAIYAGATSCSSTITSQSTTFCTGGSIVLSASTGSAYKWFNGTTQVGTAATYIATTVGAYTVEVTNASGCKATSAVTQITVNTLPTATITSPANSFCTGASVILTASTGNSYKWFSGTTQVASTATYTATAAGAYSVEVTNNSGCKATSAAKIITVNPLPTATITSPATSFCTGSSVVLTSSTGASYKWFNGTTQVGTAATYTATTAGAYSVEVTNAAGCKATSTATQITVNALPTAIITTPVTSFCTGSSTVLTASTGTSYKWFTGITQVGTTSTYTATNSGAYTVEVTNASGCKTTSAVTQISVNALPTASITAPAISFCTGGSVILTSSTAASYKWFEGTTQVGTAATYTATTAGAYTVEATNTSGCKATSVVTQITVNALPTASIAAPATSFCAGGSVILTSSTAASYKWFEGTTQVGTAATYTATTAGAYTVEATNTSGCKATSVVTQITVNALPTASIAAPATSFCAGSSVILTSSTGASYKWFNGTTQVGTASTYTAITAGAYSVEVTNANTCKATSAVTQITVNSLPTAIITTPTSSFCTGGSVILTSSTAASYKWFNGTTQVGNAATYTATTAGAYTVEVTNANGCKETSAITQITVTNSITWYADADNDGKGDPFTNLDSCTQPSGYVSISGDACPIDPNKIDAGNCGCGKPETSCLDCAGTPNGMAVFDNCNICVGGTTGNTACLSTGTINGTTANITVIPQPFDLNTRIQLENQGNIQSITIISTSGVIVKIIQEVNTNEITLGEDLASGLYSVIIQSDNRIYVTKIIKK